MLSEVRQTLQSLGVKPHSLLIVAVSGGADSVCLLHLLSEIGKDYPFRLHVGHLNHSLRGKEADDDADFVRKIASDLRISSTIVKKDIALIAKELHQSKQETARMIRYQFLDDLRNQEGGDWIATAHQASDQAETFLMRLVRGAGTWGLSSIPETRDHIIRPLLKLTREQILNYLRQHLLAYREDSSNQQPVYFRNKIRQNLLPVLKDYNPHVVRGLAHEADILSEEERALENWVDQIFPDCTDLTNQARPILFLNKFLNQTLAIQRRILRRILLNLKGNLLNIHFDHIQKIGHLAERGLTGKSLHLPGGLRVYKSYDALIFFHQNSIETKKDILLVIPVPGKVSSPELRVEINTLLIKGTACQSSSENELFFNLNKISLPLTLRNRRPGDFIYPVRLKGKRRKLQDLLVDHKISRLVRDSIPLIASPDRVLWVQGIDRDFKSLVSNQAETTLLIQINPVK